jgi:ComF family protein
MMLFSALPAWFMAHVPSQCAVCRSWPSAPVCLDCMARFAQPQARCRRCALTLPASGMLPADTAGSPPKLCPDCLRHPAGLDACFAALPYAFPWSDLIGRYKFSSQTGWAAFMANLMLAEPGVRALLASLSAEDWLLPLPLSTQRLAWRGFNQAWELASALKIQSACQASADSALLLRIRHTQPQSELKRSARLENVKGAFAVAPLRAAQLKNRRVVLVDDVMTSGASLLAAADALRQSGVREVSAVVLARTAPT